MWKWQTAASLQRGLSILTLLLAQAGLFHPSFYRIHSHHDHHHRPIVSVGLQGGNSGEQTLHPGDGHDHETDAEWSKGTRTRFSSRDVLDHIDPSALPWAALAQEFRGPLTHSEVPYSLRYRFTSPISPPALRGPPARS